MINFDIKKIREPFINKISKELAPDVKGFWSDDPTRTTIYNEDSFNYKFNNYGFRCDEFDSTIKNNNVFLGCSHTMGIGLPYEETWAFKLHTKLSKTKPFYNLSFEGSSLDIQISLLNEFIDLLNPKNVFFLLPNIYRRFFYLKNEAFNYFPLINQDKFFNKKNKHSKFEIEKIESLLLDQSYVFFEFLKNIKFLNLLATHYNFNVYISHWYLSKPDEHNFLNDIIKDMSHIKIIDVKWEIIDWGRDKRHFGPNSHTKFFTDYFNSL